MGRTGPLTLSSSLVVALLVTACDGSVDPTRPDVVEPQLGHIAGPSTTSRITFISDRDGNGEVYVMDADGSNQTRLTSTAADELWPAWSPDGSQIAFASRRDGNWEIYVMDADGSNPTRLTFSSGTDGIPAWSPDGSEIAFYSHGGIRGHFHTEVYKMAADGSAQTRITFGSGWKYGASWSPDGTRLAYRSDAGGRSRIIVSNSDGSSPTAVTGGNWDEGPDWSPDGTRIAFHGKPALSGYRWDIYAVNADGTGRTRLTATPGIDEVGPKFSSDGRILYGSSASGVFDLYVMMADGTGVTRLTDSPGHDLYGDWSPELTPPNRAPTANAGADASGECVSGGASVTLDGSASSDPDGDALSYEWSVGGAPLATGETATVTLPLGVHVVRLTVSDDDGLTDTDEVTITVEDTAPPALAFSVDVDELWPPNHAMVTVATDIRASDVCDATPSLAVTVDSNEPTDDAGDGAIEPDWLVVDNGDGSFDVQVRAERDGRGTGRIYTITATSHDASGNESVGVGEVSVPHDRGKGRGRLP